MKKSFYTGYVAYIAAKLVGMDINRWLKLRQNGVVSELMTKSGIDYKINYGVDFLEIKNRASEHKLSETECSEFLDSGCRERMLLAILSYDKENVNVDKALKFCKYIVNSEIADITGTHLFGRTHIAPELGSTLIESENEFMIRCGCATISAYLINNDTLEKRYVDKIIDTLNIDDLNKSVNVRRGYERLLGAIMRKQSDYIQNIKDKVLQNLNDKALWSELELFL